MNLVARAIAKEVDTPKARVDSALVRMPIISTGCTLQPVPCQKLGDFWCTVLLLKGCCIDQARGHAHEQQKQCLERIACSSGPLAISLHGHRSKIQSRLLKTEPYKRCLAFLYRSVIWRGQASAQQARHECNMPPAQPGGRGGGGSGGRELSPSEGTHLPAIAVTQQPPDIGCQELRTGKCCSLPMTP